MTEMTKGRFGTNTIPESFLTASNSPGLLAITTSAGRSFGMLLSLGVASILKKSAVNSLSSSLL